MVEFVCDIYIYMDTSFSTPLELLFIFCTSDQPITCEGDHLVNIPTKFGSKWQNGFREKNNGCQVMAISDLSVS
jgi:hypothetical protein